MQLFLRWWWHRKCHVATLEIPIFLLKTHCRRPGWWYIVPHSSCEILLYNRQLVVLTYKLIYVVRAAHRWRKNNCERGRFGSTAHICDTEQSGLPRIYCSHFSAPETCNQALVDLLSSVVAVIIVTPCRFKRSKVKHFVNLALKRFATIKTVSVKTFFTTYSEYDLQQLQASFYECFKNIWKTFQNF